jgi:hypothetical protein
MEEWTGHGRMRKGQPNNSSKEKKGQYKAASQGSAERDKENMTQ